MERNFTAQSAPRVAAEILASYLTCLAFEGGSEEIDKLLKKRRFLFEKRLSFAHRVTVKLILKMLAPVPEELELKDFENALRDLVKGWLRPALLDLWAPSAADIEKQCKEESEGFIEEFPWTQEWKYFYCLEAVKAVRGDRKSERFLKDVVSSKLNQVVNEKLRQCTNEDKKRRLKRAHREILTFIRERDASDVVLLWAPKTSLASLILILCAFLGPKCQPSLKSDKELIRVHSMLASVYVKGKLLQALFREAAEARSEEELKLAILKLFYLHF